jgi:hypothetical protein
MVGRISGFGPISYNYSPSFNGVSNTSPADGVSATSESKEDSKAVGKAEKKGECQTCKNRKYVDGSDEMVSFKSPAKISPEAAPSMVRAHEQEHVSNAYAKASKAGGKVMQASVAIKMAICPECGRAYIAGGTTTTQIKYPGDKYSQNQKSANYDAFAGSNIDTKV